VRYGPCCTGARFRVLGSGFEVMLLYYILLSAHSYVTCVGWPVLDIDIRENLVCIIARFLLLTFGKETDQREINSIFRMRMCE
jgi:hypothetical protein